MPKRQKAKIPSARTTIDKTPSPTKLKRIAEQNERATTNRENYPAPSPWEVSKAKRARNRIAQGVRAKWRKANRSSIGEKPSISNTAY